MVVRDIERDEIELISKTLGCLPIAHVDNMKPEKLGSAKLVEEVEVRMKSLCCRLCLEGSLWLIDQNYY
jgi:T-complex protein 1 subunit delta